MNNNRQAGRRRGRSNNNRSQNNNRNGFDYQNRIDNRARGNAAQMLEKYKKLASDAQHNDDRVNAEYYLQFADHYFRVLADFRSRQEARQEEHNARRFNRDEDRDNGIDDEAGEDAQIEMTEADGDESEAGEAADDGRSQDEGNRRNSRPQNRGGRQRNNNRRQDRDHSSEDGNVQDTLDLSVLPPALGSAANEDGEEAAEKPARKPRARRAKTVADDEVATAAE